MRAAIRTSVQKGMRLSLGMGNILTGSLYVNVVALEDAEPAELGEAYGYPSIPTIGGGLQRIEQRIGRLLDKINALPLEATVAGLNTTLEEATHALKSALEENSGDQETLGQGV